MNILYDAVKANDLVTLKTYLNTPHRNVDIFNNNNDLLLFAAGTNAVDVVNFLLTSPDLSIHSDDAHKSKCILSNKVDCDGRHQDLNCLRVANFAKEKALITACTYGCFSTIRYLLTCENFSTPIDIHYNNDEALATTCRGGQPMLAQYLLTCKKLKERANIQAYDNRALRWALRSSLPNENVVKYLLTNHKLKEHANIYDNDCKPFFELVNTTSNSKDGVWNYLVFDYKIKVLPPIEKFMNDMPHHIGAQLLIKRELNNCLNIELALKTNYQKFSKSKI